MAPIQHLYAIRPPRFFRGNHRKDYRHRPLPFEKTPPAAAKCKAVLPALLASTQITWRPIDPAFHKQPRFGEAKLIHMLSWQIYLCGQVCKTKYMIAKLWTIISHFKSCGFPTRKPKMKQVTRVTRGICTTHPLPSDSRFGCKLQEAFDHFLREKWEKSYAMMCNKTYHQ